MDELYLYMFDWERNDFYFCCRCANSKMTTLTSVRFSMNHYNGGRTLKCYMVKLRISIICKKLQLTPKISCKVGNSSSCTRICWILNFELYHENQMVEWVERVGSNCRTAKSKFFEIWMMMKLKFFGDSTTAR
jgi:hypothetical protein